MEFLRKQFDCMLNLIFDENDSKVENTKTKFIIQDDCEYCSKKCHKRCACRCHIQSCTKCDTDHCDFQNCHCECHNKLIPGEKVATPDQPQEETHVASLSDIRKQSKSSAEEPEKRENILETYIKSKLKNEGETNVIQTPKKISLDLLIPVIKFKSKMKKFEERSNNFSKVNSSKSRSENSFLISKSVSTSSFHINKNPFAVSEIKSRVERMKFRDLSPHPANEEHTSQFKRDISPQSAIGENTPQPEPLVSQYTTALSPIQPPSRKNSHLSSSFDLNNSKLYHGKSSVVKRMDDLKREVHVKKSKDKEFQVKTVLKGFETQDAWQMYNSLIFANPTILPNAKDLIKSSRKNA